MRLGTTHAHQTRRQWGVIRHYAAGHSLLLIGAASQEADTPRVLLKAVDEDPDEAGALLDFYFTNPSANWVELSSYM
jgi:hypothetical protein